MNKKQCNALLPLVQLLPAVQIVLQLGLNTNDLKLVSALIVAVFLSVPYWKGKVAHKKGGARHA